MIDSDISTDLSQDKHVICLLSIPDGYDLLIKAIRIIFCDKFYGWEVLRAKDKLLKFNSHLSNLMCHIKRSQCYIVDISDQDPDVMFQAGMMASFHDERPLIFICQEHKKNSICDSLFGTHITYYSWNGDKTNLDSLIKQLSEGFRRRKYLDDLNQFGKYHYLEVELFVYKEICAENAAKILAIYYTTIEEFVKTKTDVVAKRTDLEVKKIQHYQDMIKAYYEIFEDADLDES
ncbi:hypothetical protein [Pseudanabaena sp. ABRG5-3]|uniref:hypothetical protein n=1 Tax=Pseudanabaena sp. ABRG5-3 TaxID=685565 RepID=UPI000F82ED80|nr:hypothetical protein [Pseudanabaena sp. ABRG5-3]